MKRKLLGKSTALALVALMFFTLTPGVAMADETGAEPELNNSVEISTLDDTQSGECGEDISWTLDSNGTLTISGNGDMEFDEDDEDENCNPWGDYRELIKTVVIEYGITSIEYSAFYDCTNLTSVTIPESVTRINRYAFYNCSSLTNVIIPESVTSIGYSAFNSCSSLKSITIPASVQSINDNAFRGCSSLETVMFADGSQLKKIGEEAFYNCTNLKSIELPDSLLTISEYAFGFYKYEDEEDQNEYAVVEGFTIKGAESSAAQTYADKYEEITFEGNGKKINLDEVIDEGSCGEEAAWSLTRGGTLTVEGSGDMEFDEDDEDENCNPWEDYRELIKTVVIDDGITSIVYSAFCDCTNLTSVTIPESVTRINRNAFYNCSSLTNVIIPESVTSIGYSAFNSCSSLESITIPASVQSINDNVFRGCSSLESITIPASVQSINDNAFRGCSSLETVMFADGSQLKKIGEEAFYNCTNLKSIELPDSLLTISEYALGFYEYEDEEDSNEYAVVEDFTIKGAEGSAAQTYADKYEEITFESNLSLKMKLKKATVATILPGRLPEREFLLSMEKVK